VELVLQVVVLIAETVELIIFKIFMDLIYLCLILIGLIEISLNLVKIWRGLHFIVRLNCSQTQNHLKEFDH
jgi:hypothetical protein